MLVTMKMSVFWRVTLHKPLCDLCYYTVIVSVDVAAMVGLLVTMKWKGFWRKTLWPSQHTSLEFAWED
jgi:hypothetical protein